MHPGMSPMFLLRGLSPRTRGKHWDPQAARNMLIGLSPRTRGKQKGLPPVGFCGRSIPAHAGETRHIVDGFLRRAVYPRARGGNALGYPGQRVPLGLSPRTRGKPLNRMSPDPRRRSIPAHAGETRIAAIKQHLFSVYPRARGGNLNV